MIRNNILYALYSNNKIDIDLTSNDISKILHFLLINRIALIYKDIIPRSKLFLLENNYLYENLLISEKKISYSIFNSS